jgi:hypothetical protein
MGEPDLMKERTNLPPECALTKKKKKKRKVHIAIEE